MPRIWDYEVVNCKHMVDGDTYDLTVSKSFTNDFGFNHISTINQTVLLRFRLMSVDTFEKNAKGGAKAMRDAEAWINSALIDGVLRGTTFKSEGVVADGQFGRWLIDLYRTDTGDQLSEVLRVLGDVDLESKWTTKE